MTRIAALALAVLVALAGCATNVATGRDSFTGLMPPADEQRIGAEEHPRLVRQFGGAYEDPQLEAYVRSVGEKVVAATEQPGQVYTFTILDDASVNAFALPGGYIYVTRGLLVLAGNEAELAGVLAHEVGHVIARHPAERYSQAVAANMGAAVLTVLAQAAGVEAGDAAAAGAAAYVQSYSRDQEFEADTLGVRYLARAGYDPKAMSTFLAKLAKQARIDAAVAGDPGRADSFDMFASHPRTADRIETAVEAAAAVVPATQPTVGRDAYLAQIDGLVYGDDPSQGVRVGREFLHPELGIAFKVPPGFSMINTPARVIARNGEGATLVFDMAPLDQARGVGDLPAYVARTWGEGLALKGVERIEVNGMAGATGANRLRTKSGVADIRLVAIRERPGRIYRFVYVTPPAVSDRLTPALRESTYSFRRLSQSEAAAVQPLRVRVVTVQPGDTIQDLAARMPFESFRLERFMALNGLTSGQPLRPGRQAKIIAR